MTAQRFWSPLAEEVLGGTRRDLRLHAAAGHLPLSPNEILAVQVVLAQIDDEEVATSSLRSVRETPPERIGTFISEDATPVEVVWLARNLEDSDVLGAVLRRRDTPTSLLVELASRLDEERQEMLLLRQDRIVENPEILDALEVNPKLSRYAQRRILEYREHLVGQEEFEEASEEEVAAALVAAREIEEQGEKDETTDLTDNQIRSLPPSVKLKLARGCRGTLRFILVRDSIARIALTALTTGGFSDTEVEGVARQRGVSDDVLEAIAANRQWSRRYPVVLALCSNPKTRVATAMRLLPLLAVRDLRGLGRDRNVAETIRSRAHRLYTMKTS